MIGELVAGAASAVMMVRGFVRRDGTRTGPWDVAREAVRGHFACAAAREHRAALSMLLSQADAVECRPAVESPEGSNGCVHQVQ